MTNLVAINGPWQTITFLSFYQLEYENRKKVSCTIVFYEIDDELKNVCKTILSSYDFIENIIDFEQVNSLIDSNFENIWIGKTFSKKSKFIVDCFPDTSIILYDEGLHSYVKQSKNTLLNVLNLDLSLKAKLKSIYRYFFKRTVFKNQQPQLLLSRHVNRYSKKYYLLDIFKDSSKFIVSDKYLTQVIRSARPLIVNESIFKKNKKSVLVVGQCFNNLELVNFDQELKVYQSIIIHYLNKNYEVFWKGHPRSKMFDFELNKLFKEDINIIKNNIIPIEILIYGEYNIELCGLSSSVLLYHSLLFKGKTKQALNLIEPYLHKNGVWYKDFNKMFLIIRKHVPKLNIN